MQAISEQIRLWSALRVSHIRSEVNEEDIGVVTDFSQQLVQSFSASLHWLVANGKHSANDYFTVRQFRSQPSDQFFYAAGNLFYGRASGGIDIVSAYQTSIGFHSYTQLEEEFLSTFEGNEEVLRIQQVRRVLGDLRGKG